MHRSLAVAGRLSLFALLVLSLAGCVIDAGGRGGWEDGYHEQGRDRHGDRDRDDDHDDDEDGGDYAYGYGRPPGGSYRHTCTNAFMDGHRLKAACRTRDGDWRNASLDVRKCGGDIVNDDGRLVCARDASGWPGKRLPPGSYALSCGNIRVSAGALRADCRKADGGLRDTAIAVDACARFGNRDGRLVCE